MLYNPTKKKMATDVSADLNGDLRTKATATVHVTNRPGPVTAAVGILTNKPWVCPNPVELKNEARKPEGLVSTSAYTLASDQSLYSFQVDSWLRGRPVATTENAGVQHTRTPNPQRRNVTAGPILDPTGLWYLLAMILPLFSVNNSLQWGWCTQEAVMNAGEILIAQLSRYCQGARLQLRRLTEEQFARDLFATFMDIVLIVYAIGFLILSLYQACLFT